MMVKRSAYGYPIYVDLEVPEPEKIYSIQYTDGHGHLRTISWNRRD